MPIAYRTVSYRYAVLSLYKWIEKFFLCFMSPIRGVQFGLKIVSDSVRIPSFLLKIHLYFLII